MNRPRALARGVAAVLVTALALAGCSLRQLAVSSLADALAGGGAVYASDDDPELVRDALPFALKTLESLLVEAPAHRGLLLATARGFTQYAYAFVDTDAFLLEGSDHRRAAALRRRARGLYLRGRDYGLRGLELAHHGIGQALLTDARAAVAPVEAEEVGLLFWTAAGWGGAISMAKDDPALVADFPAVKAMLARALELDAGFEGGTLHETMIALESLPAVMGGSVERARWHFARAVELGGGRRPGPYVALAVGVALPAQDRAEFERLLGQALALDPDAEPSQRLATLITQRRARALLARAGDLFLDDVPADEPGEGSDGDGPSARRSRDGGELPASAAGAGA